MAHPHARTELYKSRDPGIAVVDDVLSPAALAGLLKYARGATIWHDTKVGYLGAYRPCPQHSHQQLIH